MAFYGLRMITKYNCRAPVDQAGNGLFSPLSLRGFHPSDDGSSFSDDDNDDIDDNDGFWGNES